MGFLTFPGWIKPEIIPGFPVRWYGLMYLFAFATAYWLIKRQVKAMKNPFTDDDVTNYLFWAILGLLLGARIFATTIYDPTGYYVRHPWLIFWPFRNGHFVGLQGMSYHGGVVGCALATWIYCRKKKFSYLQWADLTAAAIPLGYTFGRLGNFINGELWGRVTSVPWGMVFPHAPKFSSRLPWVRELAEKAGMDLTGMSMVNLPRHPSQLYEAFFEGIVLWLVLWFIVRKVKRYHGQVFGSYLMGYGLIRFVIEYFREPDADMGFPIQFVHSDAPAALLVSPWNFSTGQILCSLMILAGALMIILVTRFPSLHIEGEKKKEKKK